MLRRYNPFFRMNHLMIQQKFLQRIKIIRHPNDQKPIRFHQCGAAGKDILRTSHMLQKIRYVYDAKLPPFLNHLIAYRQQIALTQKRKHVRIMVLHRIPRKINAFHLIPLIVEKLHGKPFSAAKIKESVALCPRSVLLYHNQFLL